MATISFYHDTRRMRADGTAAVKLTIRYAKKSVMIKTDVNITPAQWQATTMRVVNHPRRKMLNVYLDTLRLNAEQILRDMTTDQLATLSPVSVRSAVMKSRSLTVTRPTVVDVFSRVANDVRTKQRTHELYDATLKKLQAYLGAAADALTFEEITRAWLSDFDAWMTATSPSRNARNIHLRNLRHVCNVALAEHITTFYDFRGYHIKAVPTVKRSLSVERLRTLFAYDVEPHQRKYLDFFKLTFFLIGINTIDLCHLRKTDVRDGRIEYTRSKTGRHYSIKVEREAQDIINTYAGARVWMLDVLDRYTDFKDFRHRLNDNLQKIGAVEINRRGKKTREPLFPSLTTYWARHSWATIAASLDVPNETIAAALGHAYGNRTTAIYIDFDRRKIDDANRRVIDWVLYGKK